MLTPVTVCECLLQRSVSQRRQLTSMLQQLRREEADFLKLLHRTLVNTSLVLELMSDGPSFWYKKHVG